MNGVYDTRRPPDWYLQRSKTREQSQRAAACNTLGMLATALSQVQQQNLINKLISWLDHNDKHARKAACSILGIFVKNELLSKQQRGKFINKLSLFETSRLVS